MPPAPKLCRALGGKGLVEILRQSHTKHLSASDHDIHTAGKLHIQLHGIGNGCHDHDGTAVVLIVVKDLCYQIIKAICNDHLFKKSPEDTDRSLRQIFGFQAFSTPQCIRCLGIHGNGSFHDLREKA